MWKWKKLNGYGKKREKWTVHRDAGIWGLFIKKKNELCAFNLQLIGSTQRYSTTWAVFQENDRETPLENQQREQQDALNRSLCSSMLTAFLSSYCRMSFIAFSVPLITFFLSLLCKMLRHNSRTNNQGHWYHFHVVLAASIVVTSTASLFRIYLITTPR